MAIVWRQVLLGALASGLALGVSDCEAWVRSKAAGSPIPALLAAAYSDLGDRVARTVVGDAVEEAETSPAAAVAAELLRGNSLRDRDRHMRTRASAFWSAHSHYLGIPGLLGLDVRVYRLSEGLPVPTFNPEWVRSGEEETLSRVRAMFLWGKDLPRLAADLGRPDDLGQRLRAWASRLQFLRIDEYRGDRTRLSNLLRHATSLRSLELNRVGYGDYFGAISPTLRRLHVSENSSFEGTIDEISLSNALENGLQHLEELDLEGVGGTAGFLADVAPPTLTRLGLRFYEYHNVDPLDYLDEEALITALRLRVPHLTHLDLEGSWVTGRFLSSLPRGLQSLHLVGTSFMDEGVRCLEPALGELALLSELRSLDLGDTDFFDSAFLLKLPPLQRLSLAKRDRVKVDPKGDLEENLKRALKGPLADLRDLDLSGRPSRFTDGILGAIPAGVERLSLRGLKPSSTWRFNWGSALDRVLARHGAQMSNLVELDVSDTRFRGDSLPHLSSRLWVLGTPKNFRSTDVAEREIARRGLYLMQGGVMLPVRSPVND